MDTSTSHERRSDRRGWNDDVRGYIGGAAALPQAAGGAGFDQGQVHELISQFVEPIGGAFLLLLAGVLVVDLGYLMAYRKAVTP